MSMYCPQCRTEYRDGFLECTDCGVALVCSLPKKPQPHTLDLVTVLQTGDSFALTLAKSALEDAGIEYVVSGGDPRYIAGFRGAFGVGAIPLGKCSCRVQVASESEPEARVLLEPLQEPVAVPDIEGEENS